MTSTDWIARGGAFWLIGGSWVLVGAIFFIFGMRFGRRPGNGGDGCLLSIAGVVMTLLGGGIGLMIARYPWFIVTSVTGCILLPSVTTAILTSKARR